MKKATNELKNLYTAHVSDDKPVVQRWVGIRAGDSAFICAESVFSSRRRSNAALRRHESSKVFDSAEAAVASLKPVKGWATKWRGSVIPALIVKGGDGKLRATDKDGNSLGAGYLTKRQAAYAALKDALEWEKRAKAEYTERHRTVEACRKILRSK